MTPRRDTAGMALPIAGLVLSVIALVLALAPQAADGAPSAPTELAWCDHVAQNVPDSDPSCQAACLADPSASWCASFCLYGSPSYTWCPGHQPGPIDPGPATGSCSLSPDGATSCSWVPPTHPRAGPHRALWPARPPPRCPPGPAGARGPRGRPRRVHRPAGRGPCRPGANPVTIIPSFSAEQLAAARLAPPSPAAAVAAEDAHHVMLAGLAIEHARAHLRLLSARPAPGGLVAPADGLEVLLDQLAKACEMLRADASLRLARHAPAIVIPLET